MTTPDTDNQIHRDQRSFKKHVEQNAVKRTENTVKQTRHDQECGVVLCHLELNHLPASQHDDQRNETIQDDERHRNAIYTQVVVDVEAWNPRRQFYKLHHRCRSIKLGVQRNSNQKTRQGTDQRKDTRQPRVAITTDCQNKQAGHDGNPNGKRE